MRERPPMPVIFEKEAKEGSSRFTSAAASDDCSQAKASAIDAAFSSSAVFGFKGSNTILDEATETSATLAFSLPG